MADPCRRYGYLEQLSVERLEELLDSAVRAEEETNPAYIDTILKLIVKKETENPNGRFTDIDKAWNDFQTYYNTADGRGKTLYFSEKQEPEGTPERPLRTRRKRLRWVRKTAFAAVLICLMLGAAAAQAAGFHAFRTLAHWTEDILTFGVPGAQKAVNMTFGETEDGSNAESDGQTPPIRTSKELSYASLREALDDYSITEITEPSVLPDGYALEMITGLDGMKFYMDAMYTNGSNMLSFSMISHTGSPSTQVEKGDSPVEIFEKEDTIFYLVENTNNYAVVWLTEHYECFITAPLNIEKDTLKEMAFSMVP